MCDFVFSFETTFILFLFAGRYKADPRLNWIPIDITALLLIINILIALYLFFKRRVFFSHYSVKLVISGYFFVLYSFASLLWSIGDEYATIKSFYIITLFYWPLIASSLIIASSELRIKRLITLLFIFSLWITTESLFQYFSTGSYTFVNVLGSNYLGVGRIVGMGAVIIWANIQALQIYWQKKITLLLLLGIFMYSLMIIGGRGPLIATAIPMLLITAIAYMQSHNKVKLFLRFVFILIAAAIISIVGSTFIKGFEIRLLTIDRLLLIGQTGSGEIAGVRQWLYEAAVNMWYAKPIFGYGIGSFPIYIDVGDIKEYPHNLILEILAELGLLGCIFFVVPVYLAVKYLCDFWANKTLELTIVSLLLNAIINALFSGDIPDNRAIYAFLGLLTFGSVNVLYRNK
jgi:O-antigen ligase